FLRTGARRALAALLGRRGRRRRLLQLGQGDEVVRRERVDLGAAQLGDVAVAAEVAAEVARDRAHIGALAALDLEHGRIGIRHGDQIEAGDLDLAGGNLDRLALAGEIVGALAGDLDRRELRRRLHDDAGIFRHRGADLGLARTGGRGLRRRALEIVGGALLAPGDGEAVDL